MVSVKGDVEPAFHDGTPEIVPVGVVLYQALKISSCQKVPLIR